MKNTLKRILSTLSLTAMCAVLFSGMLPVFADAGTATTGGLSVTPIIMIVVMLAVFYFFMIRPEQKKRKQTEEMRSKLGVGDKITTIGGMVGKIVDINNDLITFETGEDRVRIQVTKWAISTNGIQKKEEGEK